MTRPGSSSGTGTSSRSASDATQARPERSGRVFFCPFVSGSCPAPGLEDRAKRTERRAARSRIRGFRPETPGKRANLAELEALGHGNRAPARRETAFCLSNRDANTPAPARAARAAHRDPIPRPRGTGPRDPIPRPRSLKVRSRCPAARAGTASSGQGPLGIGSFS